MNTPRPVDRIQRLKNTRGQGTLMCDHGGTAIRREGFRKALHMGKEKTGLCVRRHLTLPSPTSIPSRLTTRLALTSEMWTEEAVTFKQKCLPFSFCQRGATPSLWVPGYRHRGAGLQPTLQGCVDGLRKKPSLFLSH